MNSVDKANGDSPVVNMSMTIEQASAVNMALDFFVRIGIGQLEELADLVRSGIIPIANVGSKREERKTASPITCDSVHELMLQVKALMGYPSNGSHSIGHEDNHINTTRAYEVHKVLSKALADHRDPNPMFRGTHHDGLLLRYTDDPAPTAEIVEV